METRVESSIEQVTVFPGAARITRLARVSITGRTELRLVGLPLLLDDDSLQVSLDGPARAADLRVTVEVIGREHASADHDEVHGLRRAAVAAQAVRDRLRAEARGLEALDATPRSTREQAAPAWSDAVAARLAALDALAGRQREVREELVAAEKAATDAERAWSAARTRIERASSAHLQPGALRKTVIATVLPEGAGGDVTLTLGYLVGGASWAPSYTARLDGAGGVRFELRASVAQATGEDWSRVRLEVSTAAPGRWLDLPELPSRRVGRRQPAPARPGWRPPPAGVDALFSDFERDFPRPPPDAPRATAAAPPPAPAPPPPPQVQAFAYGGAPAEQAAAPRADRQRERRMAPGGAPPPMAPPMMAPPSAAAPAPMMKTMMASMAPQGRGEGGGGAARARDEQDEAEEANLEAELVVGAQLLVYARLRMAGPHELRRGRLVPMSRDQAWGVAPDVAAQVAGQRGPSLPPTPPGLRPVSGGVYDHAFASDGRVDVPGDGSWHNLALLARDAAISLGHVVVPSIALDVYRQATLQNPLDAPLLAGPVDVYDRGELVTTTTVDTTPPGATVELGLGVDATVKVARNARYREEVAGVLRGALKLIHEVTIDVENLGGRAVALEVRERVPLPAAGTDDVEVELDRVQPPWEAWRPEPGPGEAPLRGGHRWRLDVAPRSKQVLRADYHVRISQKHELVGGNRREP